MTLSRIEFCPTLPRMKDFDYSNYVSNNNDKQRFHIDSIQVIKEIIADINKVLFTEKEEKLLSHKMQEIIEESRASGIFILNILFPDLYRNIYEIFSNGYDALVANETIGSIKLKWKVNINEGTITFFYRDDGLGINGPDTLDKLNNSNYIGEIGKGEELISENSIIYKRISGLNGTVVCLKISLESFKLFKITQNLK